MKKFESCDFTKLGKKAFLAFLEKERQEMLAAGMSEADIQRLHFGELDENGKPLKDGHPGDYAMWQAERKHKRPDHKYACGAPLSLESLEYEGTWVKDDTAEKSMMDVDRTLSIEAMLQTLSPKQSVLARALVFGGITAAEYACDNKISKAAVSQTLVLVRKKLKKFFE